MLETGIRQAAAEVLPPYVIEDPVYFVAVVPDVPQGRLSSHDRDVFGAAHVMLAEHSGAALLCVLFGPCDEDLAAIGVDRVVRMQGPEFDDVSPDARCAGLARLSDRLSIRHWLFPDSDPDLADLARRLAARLGGSAVTDIQKLESGGRVVRRMRSGTRERVFPRARVMLLDAEVEELRVARRHEARALPPPPPTPSTGRTSVIATIAGDPASIPLQEARLVIAGGNGVGDWNLFHQVAQLLGAAEGASRVAVDAGAMPRARQIGASGTAISARVYVAIGISGAPQHLQGIQRCEKVVAINIDVNCELARRADLTIVGDAQPILRALSGLLREEQ